METSQVVGLAVTGAIFLFGQTVALFKWIKALERGNAEFMASMNVRTELMSDDLKDVNDTLKRLADTSWRISSAETSIKDHEARLRRLESE